MRARGILRLQVACNRLKCPLGAPEIQQEISLSDTLTTLLKKPPIKKTKATIVSFHLKSLI